LGAEGASTAGVPVAGAGSAGVTGASTADAAGDVGVGVVEAGDSVAAAGISVVFAGSALGNSIAFPSASWGGAAGVLFEDAVLEGAVDVSGSSSPLVLTGASNFRLGFVGGTLRSPGIFGGMAGVGLSLLNQV